MKPKRKKIICRDKDDNKYEADEEKLKFRPSVYGILIEKGKILLSKEWDGYSFPGGGIKISETIKEASRREFFEETGIKVEPIKVLHVETDFFHPAHSSKHKGEYWNCQLIYFLVKKVGGKLSKDNFDDEEKKYADFAGWIDVKKVNKIKIYNGKVDSVKLIKEAANLKDKL